MKKQPLSVLGVVGLVGLTFACSGTGLIIDIDGGSSSSSSGNLPWDGGTSSGSTSGSTTSSSTSSSSGSTSSSSTSSSSSGGASDAGASCYDQTMAGVYKSADPLLHQNKATAADIDAFYTACLQSNATQATCDAYVGTKAAPQHTAVVNCLFPFYNPALDQATLDALPSPALVPWGDSAIGVNVEACRMLAAGAPAGCAMNAKDYATCARSACSECMDEPSNDACIAQAQGSDCSSFAPGAACDTAVANGAAAADALCGAAGIGFDASYFKVAAAFCGP